MKLFSKRAFFLGILIGTTLLGSYLFTLPDKRLHIVFCDVGQGDAIYIRTPSNTDMLIDGGPDDKVLACLGRHMPFYDRTIDMVFLTHPQKDHFSGLLSVVQRYKVRYFVAGVVGSDNQGYKKLVEEIRKKNIAVKNLYEGDQFSFGRVKFAVLWPEREWLASNLSDFSYLPPQAGLSDLSSSRVLGFSTRRNINDFSFYLHLRYGIFDTLFTGDGDARIQPEILSRVELPNVEVLKFPHHGSKYGALEEFLDKVAPELAVISVGKNPWGHPTKEALKLLSKKAIRVVRTDLEGDVEVVSDGREWEYR